MDNLKNIFINSVCVRSWQCFIKSFFSPSSIMVPLEDLHWMVFFMVSNQPVFLRRYLAVFKSLGDVQLQCVQLGQSQQVNCLILHHFGGALVRRNDPKMFKRQAALVIPSSTMLTTISTTEAQRPVPTTSTMTPTTSKAVHAPSRMLTALWLTGF